MKVGGEVIGGNEGEGGGKEGRGEKLKIYG